jgi:hypothetical protein
MNAHSHTLDHEICYVACCHSIGEIAGSLDELRWQGRSLTHLTKKL